MLGGTARAIRHCCQALETRLADVGLTTNRDKCEIIPAASTNHSVPADFFAGYKFKADGNFKLLGAPFGTAAFCTAHTTKRHHKAQKLLNEVASMEDKQCALLLTRHCNAFCKLAYSARVVPPQLHAQALRDFDADVRKALAEVVGSEVDPRGWHQAQLSLKQGGLGLRATATHASAAFVASVSSCTGTCSAIDSAFDPTDANGHLSFQEAKQSLQASFLPDAAVDLQARPFRQKNLSRLVDSRLRNDLKTDPSADETYKAHLELQSLTGAGAWLTASPADDERTLDPLLFQTGLKRKLRLRVQDEDAFCPLCGGTMDCYGDHALVCPCNGDRTVRHNALRNVVFADASKGALGAEREKAGLLPARPTDDGLRQQGEEQDLNLRQRRRPADVFLRRLGTGGPAALDFACTSGMRSDRLQLSRDTPELVLTKYEETKREYKAPGETETTEALCTSQGLRFVPMVVEAHSGGWSKAAREVLDTIAKSVATQWKEDNEVASLAIAQRLSVTLHRENARAIVRRRQEPTLTAAPDAVPADEPGLW